MRVPILIVSLFVSLLAPLSAVAAERVVRETIPVNPDVRFSLDAERASVEITTGDVDTVQLAVYLEHDQEEVLERVHVDIESSPAYVSLGVSFEEPNHTFLFGFIDINDYEYPQIRFEVVIPDEASLTVDGHRSRVDIEAPAGRVDLSMHRSNGRISAVRNDLKLITQRGNFDVDIRQLHNVDLSTVRGNVNLEVSGATDYRLQGEAERGDIRFIGQSIMTEARRRGVFVEHVAGTGSNFVNLEAQRGNIRVNFRE